MLNMKKLSALLILAALLVSACQPIAMPPETAEMGIKVAPAEGEGFRPDAPAYALRGPYAVGVRSFSLEGVQDTELPLNVIVWYPALNPDGMPAGFTYEMGFDTKEMPPFLVYGHAIEDADPVAGNGPFPLVVHSHGHWSYSGESVYLFEHLASHGFVVMSTEHEDNWSTAWNPRNWQNVFMRVNDVRRQIDFAEEIGGSGGLMAGMINTDQVAVSGWSLGGETALIAGGARFDPAHFGAWCRANAATNEEEDPDCINILGHLEELAALAGHDVPSDGIWPNWGDERVAAIVPLAPWVAALGPTGVREVNVPTLIIYGSGDAIVGEPAYDISEPYREIGVEHKAEAIFENAGHFIFRNSCEAAPELPDMGFHWYCADAVWEMDRAHDLINHFVTAFLVAELKDDPQAASMLAPENVAMTGITYQAAGYIAD